MVYKAIWRKKDKYLLNDKICDIALKTILWTSYFKHLCLKITLTKELSEGEKEKKNASNCLSNARNMAMQVTGLTFW